MLHVLLCRAEGKKWRFLEHNGVIFPPKYEPHGVKMNYDGKQVELTPDQVRNSFSVYLFVDIHMHACTAAHTSVYILACRYAYTLLVCVRQAIYVMPPHNTFEYVHVYICDVWKAKNGNTIL
jgi:hypothetical protein